MDSHHFVFSEIVYEIETFFPKVNETVENVLQTEILKPAIHTQGKVFEAVKRNMQAARHKVRARKKAARAISHTFAVGRKGSQEEHQKSAEKRRKARQRFSGSLYYYFPTRQRCRFI